jgi:hypothetical protein
MHAVDIIRQKRDGGGSSEDQIDFCRWVTDGSIPDYRPPPSSWPLLRGMTDRKPRG